MLGGVATEDRTNGVRDVAVQLSVGRADLLEVQDVEELAGEGDPVAVRRPPVGTGDERTADPDDSGDAIRVPLSEGPRDPGTPVVADHDRALEPEGVEEPEDVPAQVVEVVVGDCVGAGGAAVATLIGRDRSEPAGGEGRKLVPPRVGELREAVEEDDGEAVARREDVQLGSVDRDEMLLHLGHARTGPRRRRPGSSPVDPSLRRTTRPDFTVAR